MFDWSLSSNTIIIQGVIIALVAFVIGFRQLSWTQIVLIGLLSTFIFVAIESLKLYYPHLFLSQPKSEAQSTTKLNRLWIEPTPKATKAGLRTTRPLHPIHQTPQGKRVKFNRNVETVNQYGQFSNEVLHGQTCLDD
jgi:Na+(H+)/acetate symporter ActP